MNLHEVRQDYARQQLSEADCAITPQAQLQRWVNEAMAAKIHEPTAMNIATVDTGHRPDSRMVLLKEANDDGLVFFTNYDSRKGEQLTRNPFIAVNFFWPQLERQIRVRGQASRLPESDSDTYFQSRPYASRIGAWASEQSRVIASKNVLMERAAALALRYPFKVPRPPHWGGWLIAVHEAEFWQGRPSRLHDRIHYRLEDGAWTKERLAP